MARTMTSKERVLVTFDHGEPDRVPINYLANPGIDRRLKRHFGLDGRDNEGLRQALGVDFRSVAARYVGPKLHEDIPDEGVIVDNWGVRRKWVPNEWGGYFDYFEFPLKNADEAEVAAWPMPSPDDYDYSVVEPYCDRMSSYALIAGGAGLPDIINANGFLRGMEQTLVDLITDDPAGLLLAERRTEINVEIIQRTLESANGKIDLLWMGEDLGTQIAPMISPELFRNRIRPLHQRVVDVAKAYDIPVMIHSCGSSSWAFADFIDMGIAAVDTLQPEAVNMEPEYLKRQFGDRLAFHGCISTAGPVSFGSAQDVIDDCTEILDVMMPGGGYCFSPTHALQDNSPTENVLAMYETAHAVGIYS